MYLFIFLSTVLSHIHAEIFTSMANMEQMVLFEQKMFDVLQTYISEEEERIRQMKKFMLDINDILQNTNTSEDIGKHLGNPVNSYLMLKRFNVDWKKLEKMVHVNSKESLNNVFRIGRPHFPKTEDHEGAMDALFRLQTTYELQASSLVKGAVPGSVQPSAPQPLSLQDIYELGIHAYMKGKWSHAIQWLQIALDQLNNHGSSSNIDKSDVMDYLAYALFQFGEVEKAYKFTEELSKLRPLDKRIASNLALLQGEIKHIKSSKRGEIGDTKAPIKEPTEEEITTKNYEKLCRGEARDLTKKEQLKLKCWYRQTDPILRLKPQKVERLWVTPEILLFHEFIRDTQSNWIKETAYPMLRRATIYDPITKELGYADYRVSKSAWLSPDEHIVVRNIQTRAEAVTGLDMKYAEPLQTENYGIGGYYEPHFDHAKDDQDKFTNLSMGNRMATLLIYSTDLESGGSTVFTDAHAAVYPVKNAAVFWFNLKRNGKGDTLTRYAACPVLVGHKWVSKWWIHEYGQVFRRPCALNENW